MKQIDIVWQHDNVYDAKCKERKRERDRKIE